MRLPVPDPRRAGGDRVLLILSIALVGCGSSREPGPAVADRVTAERLLGQGRPAEALPHLLAVLRRWPTHLPSLRGLHVAATAGHRPHAEYRALARAEARRPLPRDLAARLAALRVERARALLAIGAPRSAAAELTAVRAAIPPDLAQSLAEDDLAHGRTAAVRPGMDREALAGRVRRWAASAPAVAAAAARAYLAAGGDDSAVLLAGLAAAMTAGDDGLVRDLDAALASVGAGKALAAACRLRARPGTSPSCRALRAAGRQDAEALGRWVAVCGHLGVPPGVARGSAAPRTSTLGAVASAARSLGELLASLEAESGLGALEAHWASGEVAGTTSATRLAASVREAVRHAPVVPDALALALAPAGSGDLAATRRHLESLPWSAGRERWRARLLSLQGQAEAARDVLLGLADATLDGLRHGPVVLDELRRLGDREGARQLGEVLYERRDPDGPGLGLAARALAFAGRTEGAELAALDRAAAAAHPPTVLMEAAEAMAEAGRIDRAAALAMRALEWNRGRDESLALRLHAWLLRAGRTDDAGRVAAFLRARFPDPLDRVALEHRLRPSASAPAPRLNQDLITRARAAATAGRGPEARAWLALATAVASRPPARSAVLLSGAALAHRAGEREVAARLVVQALGAGFPSLACLVAALGPGPPPDPLRLLPGGSSPCE
jgi:hypothetical protein